MKSKRSAKELKGLLPQLKKILGGIYGDRLKDVILYGSFARGQANNDSDIDLAVVIEGPIHKIKEIDRIYDSIYELMLEMRRAYFDFAGLRGGNEKSGMAALLSHPK